MSNNGAEIENNTERSENSSENQKSSEAFSSRAMDEVMNDYQAATSKGKSDSSRSATGSDGFEITGMGGANERARPASDSRDGAVRTGQRPNDTQEGSATGQAAKDTQEATITGRPAKDTQEATITGRPAKDTQEATITGRPAKDTQEGSATGQPAKDTQEGSATGQPANDTGEASRTEQRPVSRGNEAARTGVANDATREEMPETNRLSDLRGFGPKAEEGKEFSGKSEAKGFGPKTEEGKEFSGKSVEKDTDSEAGEKKKNELPDLGGDMPRELQWHEIGRAGIQGGRHLASNGGFGDDSQRQHLTESLQRIADLLPNGGLSEAVTEINRRLESLGSDMRVEIDLARQTGPNSIPMDVLGHPTSISIVRRGDARSQYLFGEYNKRK